MRVLGNILWFLLGGWLCALGWLLAGVVWCITIVGAGVGIQCFKLAGLVACPFGKTVIYGGSLGAGLLNVLWIVFAGIWLALGSILLGVLCCITIVGIPFGRQHFKFAKLALMPFGAQVVPVQ